ncbi:MAG: ACT domain-containing protein [Acidimicrobiia bacterium]
MSRCVVFTVGADRPGIVAAVTDVLARNGANLEDCAMSQLSGQFAMVLVVSAPAERAADLAAHVRSATAEFQLDVHVRPIADGVSPSETTHLASVYGADRPGIVRDVSGWLAGHGINIRDLETHVLGSEPPTYAMLIEVSLPHDVSSAVLASAFADAGNGWGVTAHLRAVDSDVL